VITLLQRDANKDAQDAKEQTPLFLAAREGSYEAVKILLDYNANRDMPDHMDKLPHNIAHERMHHDIVCLLDDYHPSGSAYNGTQQHDTVSRFASSCKTNQDAKSKAKKNQKKLAMGSRNSIANDVTSLLLPAGYASGKQQFVELPPSARSCGVARHGSNLDKKPIDLLQRQLSIGNLSNLEFSRGMCEMPPSYETACNNGKEMDSTINTISANIQLADGKHYGGKNATFAEAMNPKSNKFAGLNMYSNMNWPLQIDHHQGVGHGLPPSDCMADQSHRLYDASPHGSSNGGAGLSQNPFDSQTSVGGQFQYSAPSEMLHGSAGGQYQNFPSPAGSVGGHCVAASLRKKALPLSPTHLQAIQQQALMQRNRSHVHSSNRPPQQQQYDHGYSLQSGLQAVGGAGARHHVEENQMWIPSQRQQSHAEQHQLLHQPAHRLHHYPTPPSQHSYSSDIGAMSQPLLGFLPEHFPTPSPDSPGQWSSCSPQSAKSDWSEGISSPPMSVHQQHLFTTNHALQKPTNHALQKREDIYKH